MTKNRKVTVLEDAFYLYNSERQDGGVNLHPAISCIEVVSEDGHISFRMTQEDLEKLTVLLKEARSQFDAIA